MVQAYPPPGWQQPLPTMYDLPSEDPEEPGLPDEFHDYQPDLLTATFRSPSYPADQCFMASDLNLYYDSLHTRWYKRPDWFLVLGTTRFSQQQDLRWSYVTWQEGIAPFLVIELLSPGTEQEDLGQTLRDVSKPPGKWEVYERILRIPHYVVYDRYINKFRAFHLVSGRYQEVDLPDQKLWFEELKLGLGVWVGEYDGITGQWLRWYNAQGQWIATPSERAEQERLRAEQAEQQILKIESDLKRERQRAQQLTDYLRSLGINPDDFPR